MVGFPVGIVYPNGCRRIVGRASVEGGGVHDEIAGQVKTFDGRDDIVSVRLVHDGVTPDISLRPGNAMHLHAAVSKIPSGLGRGRSADPAPYPTRAIITYKGARRHHERCATVALDACMNRAEAMRQSILALIGCGKPYEVHPAFWTPFVVVGEGGAGRYGPLCSGRS